MPPGSPRRAFTRAALVFEFVVHADVVVFIEDDTCRIAAEVIDLERSVLALNWSRDRAEGRRTTR